jgi:hypothetical protein
LVGRPESRRLFGRTVFRCDDNIKVVQEVGWGMDWIDAAEDGDKWLAVVNAVINTLVPGNVGKFLEYMGTALFLPKDCAVWV